MTVRQLRDCVFWVADNTMAQVFQAFLTRNRFHLSLGCRGFQFDPKEDLFAHSGGNDPGLYVRAHNLVAPFARTHRYAVVALDAAWDGSPGAREIEEYVTANLTAIWPAERVRVIVIDPELESWVVQDSPHVATAFRYDGATPLRTWLCDNGHWPAESIKPPDPKAAIDAVCRLTRTARSGALYGKVVARVSVKNCVDPAFRRLADTLRQWFPPEVT